MRPNVDQYMMALARTASLRGTCSRLQVGCIIAVNGDVRATGYNGSIPRGPHCIDVGCDMVNGSCVRCVHAEINAICRAARSGVSLIGGIAYVTHEPCRACAYALACTDVKAIYFEKLRESSTRQVNEDRERVQAAMETSGITLSTLPSLT